MKKARSILTAALVLMVTGAGAYVLFRDTSGTLAPRMISSTASVVESMPPVQVVPFDAKLVKPYENKKFRFRLKLPDDFTAQEFPDEESTMTSIIFQNSKGEGIQVAVTPDKGDTRVLTADDVRSSLPDMKVVDDQALEIGDDYKGVAFRSNDPAFNGDSREVWFYFRGNLFQISTYSKFDPLLKAIFSSWQFF